MIFALSPRYLRLASAAAAALIVLGLLSVLLTDFEHSGPPRAVASQFYLGHEMNFATCCVALLLVLCAIRLAAIGERRLDHGARPVYGWYVLSLLFIYVAFDELIGIHERATDPLREALGVGGVLHFAWVIPGMLAVVLLALAFWPLLRAVPRRAATWFVVAGALFVGGAIGMELLGGWYDEQFGNVTTVYGLITWVEESLEITGTVVFLRALHLPGLVVPPRARGTADAAPVAQSVPIPGAAHASATLYSARVVRATQLDATSRHAGR